MGWIRPTNHESTDWTDPQDGYDADSDPPATETSILLDQDETSSELAMTLSAINSDLSKFFARADDGHFGYVWVRVYDGSWHQVYEGDCNDGNIWRNTDSYNYNNVTKIGVKFRNDSGICGFFLGDIWLNEVEAGVSIPVMMHHHQQMQKGI